MKKKFISHAILTITLLTVLLSSASFVFAASNTTDSGSATSNAVTAAASGSKSDTISTSEINDEDFVIAVEPGTSMEDNIAAAYPDATVQIVTNTSTALLSLKKGNIDAYAVDEIVINSIIAGGNDDIEIIATVPKVTLGQCVAVSPVSDIPNALSSINDFLQSIEEDGTLDDMLQRWTIDFDYEMPDIAEAEAPDYKIIVGTTGTDEPYTFYSNNELVGLEIEMLERFALYSNAEIEFREYSISGIFAALSNGEIDYGISSLRYMDS